MGGGLAAVMFLCDASWDDTFVKIVWTFWKHLGKGYRITLALNSSVSFFSFFTKFILFI